LSDSGLRTPRDLFDRVTGNGRVAMLYDTQLSFGSPDT
jgi:hypothetical protein